MLIETKFELTYNLATKPIKKRNKIKSKKKYVIIHYIRVLKNITILIFERSARIYTFS